MLKPRIPRARTLWRTAGVLALPWAIDYAVRRVRRTPWRPPAAPHIRISTGRLHP